MTLTEEQEKEFQDFISTMKSLGFVNFDDDANEWSLTTDGEEISLAYFFETENPEITPSISRVVSFNVNDDLITENQLKIIKSMFAHDSEFEEPEKITIEDIIESFDPEYVKAQDLREGITYYDKIACHKKIFSIDELKDTVFNDKKVLEMAARVIRENRY